MVRLSHERQEPEPDPPVAHSALSRSALPAGTSGTTSSTPACPWGGGGWDLGRSRRMPRPAPGTSMRRKRDSVQGWPAGGSRSGTPPASRLRRAHDRRAW